VRPVSQAFLDTLRGSHSAAARATVCTTFQTGTAPTGTEVPIMDGDVIVDGTAQIRSTLDLTTDGTGMWPAGGPSLFLPYGNEIYVERGIAYSGGSVEYVGLGYFRIQAPQQSRPPNGPIRITANDRMSGIIDARLLAPIQFRAGTTLGTIVSLLVFDVYPAATIEWDDSTDAATIGQDLVTTDDRFKFLDDLFVAVGKIWYWDHRGVLVIKSVPDPAEPVFDLSAGANSVLVAMSRSLTRDRVYNAVVATGNSVNSLPPVQAVAFDNNPASPTYFFGAFGPVPRFFNSPLLETGAQAASAATTLLQKALGLPYNVDLTAIPNPALEPFDPVTTRAGGSEPVETHIVQKLTIPFSADTAMTATTREQTVVLIGTM
jgi:hypothetical protein